jgi:hypothetical protein
MTLRLRIRVKGVIARISGEFAQSRAASSEIDRDVGAFECARQASILARWIKSGSDGVQVKAGNAWENAMMCWPVPDPISNAVPVRPAKNAESPSMTGFAFFSNTAEYIRPSGSVRTVPGRKACVWPVVGRSAKASAARSSSPFAAPQDAACFRLCRSRRHQRQPGSTAQAPDSGEPFHGRETAW